MSLRAMINQHTFPQLTKNDSLPVEYQRSISVIRVIIWLWALICWLLLAGTILELSVLKIANPTPVLVVATVTTLFAIKLSRQIQYGGDFRYKYLGPLLAILCVPVAYQNGYLPVTFAPLIMILSQCLYRGKGSKLFPYVIWFSWSVAVFLSPIKEGQAFAFRLLLITLFLIPVTDVLLRRDTWEHDTKTRLLLGVLAMSMALIAALGIQQFLFGANYFPALLSLAIFATCYGVVSSDQLDSIKSRLVVAIGIFGAYWFGVAENGVLPISLLAAIIFLTFLLLPAFEALFFGLGLTALSLLPLLALDTNSLDFAPAPFFTRHFAVTLILIFALYSLFRTREHELGYLPEPTPISKGMLSATTVVMFLALIEYLTGARNLTFGLNAQFGSWLISGILVWLLVTWLSSVYLRNQQSLKRSVRELASSREDLEKQLDRQRHLFAVISHELRTPAAALSMLLHDRLQSEPDDKTQSECVQLADHLVDVLSDLRQVAQPDQVRFAELKPTNLFELIERTTSSLTAILHEHNQKLSIKTQGNLPHTLLFDRQHVRQIVTNLVKNASLHSGGTEIQIDIHSDHSDHSDQQVNVQLTISDNGRGLDPSMQASLYEAFARGNTDADGTGLGLFICKQLAEQMGGELRYQPRNGGGSSFILQFSAELPNEETLQRLQPKELPDNVKGKRVLLAEDNKTIQMVTAKMLERAGVTTTLAHDGKTALELYASTPQAFDLILTDIMMPRMDGYQLTRELRELGCNLPIIGITAATIGEERERLLEQGATQVVAKPLTMDSLQSALQA